MDEMPDDVMLVGWRNTRIKYNMRKYRWEMTSDWGTKAHSYADQRSYVLGIHEWTIRNDNCNGGNSYTTELKMTGCDQLSDFTCRDGQCISIDQRCAQITNCRDESDEKDCQILLLKDGYNNKIPPISVAGSTNDLTLVPVLVSISITLMKVVEIEETDHSIHLQFQISLQWKENRVKYLNLKRKTSLNALTALEVNHLWMPLVIYDNTDQKESTRLGEYGNGEWKTRVTVTREGDFARSKVDVVDESEIFEGLENRLTMNQTYTWEFQCKYKLEHYPFDTQVHPKLRLTLNRL